MDTTMASVQPFFNWLLQTTLSGSVVIALILLAQKVLGRKLGPRWSHALWLVLLVRLMLPGTFHDQINLLSLVPSFDRQIEQKQPSGTPASSEISQEAQVSGDKTIPGQKPKFEVGPQESITPKLGMFANLNEKS